MTRVEAWYDPDQEEAVPLTGQPDVDALLDRMLAEATQENVRVQADLHYRSDDGEAILQVGMGSDTGFVGYINDTDRVISSNGTTDPGDVSFDYMTHERVVPATSLVSITAVRQVVHTFTQSPLTRPQGPITWVAV
ncbi:hypothetical protein BAY61_18235 [Prauserella marina]|uniref:Immunity protein Imm1 n=1 Tax=Prauserella marina TaxID=530584 RepID=A0A222VRS3_9PSEU|nr:Imm1 family immunity protein [Prauserella marina]ASR36617.1 hypothetical protein BAY61_18235 [Prauserella marina]PWV74031.1 immunity protein Imm1 of predicted polymorphic toxin system [Prauserella marina]SDD61311.1 Immunity protein Imm1 [Prauserella marina]